MTPIEHLLAELSELTGQTTAQVAGELITHESSDYGVLVAAFHPLVVSPYTTADVDAAFNKCVPPIIAALAAATLEA